MGVKTKAVDLECAFVPNSRHTPATCNMTTDAAMRASLHPSMATGTKARNGTYYMPGSRTST